jgi:hypothetical protein
MTGRADWILIAKDGGVVGVRSRSDAQPLKVADFPAGFQQLQGTHHYSDWVFMIPVTP